MNEGKVVVTEDGLHIDEAYYYDPLTGARHHFEATDIPWAKLPTSAYAGIILLISLDISTLPAQVHFKLGTAAGVMPTVPLHVIPLAHYHVGMDGRPEKLVDFRSGIGVTYVPRFNGVPLATEEEEGWDAERDRAESR